MKSVMLSLLRCLVLFVATGIALWAPARARGQGEVIDLAGEWKIAYGNGTTRVYVIAKDGKVQGNFEDARWVMSYKLTGQVAKRDGRLVLRCRYSSD
jgi:hypothetical protein